MTKPKLKTDVYFQGKDEEDFFLFEVLNIGKTTDELKFIFNHPQSGIGVLYSENENEFHGDELIRMQAEVSYHSDGTLLTKLPSYGERTLTVHKNPSGEGYRRTPINMLFEWEPFVQYTVVDYALCRKPLSDRAVVIPHHNQIFDGTPFDCIMFLGKQAMASPQQSPTRGVYRLESVANHIDLLCCFYKSAYRGEYMALPRTGERIWVARNVVQIAERKR